MLDVGCNTGLLVEMLRNRDVEDWGIDNSEVAIDGVDPAVQPYCRVGSILEPLDESQYDLIVVNNLQEILISWM